MLIEVRVGAAEGGEGFETGRAAEAPLSLLRARLEMHNSEQESPKLGRLRSRGRGEPELPSAGCHHCLVLIQGSLKSRCFSVTLNRKFPVL